MAVYKKVPGHETVNISTLEFDTTPTPGSLNPVTSGGVAEAVDAAKDEMQVKIDEVTLDPSAVALGNVHLLDELTELPADGTFLVDSETNGPGAMPKDTLLTNTAQNALAGNVAEEFDPTRTSENPYKAGESVAYNGKTYTFKVDHYGAWSGSDVFENPMFKIVDGLLSANRQKFSYSVSNNKYHHAQFIFNLKVGDKVCLYIGDSSDEGYASAEIYYYTTSLHLIQKVKKGVYYSITIPADCQYLDITFNYSSATTSSHEIFFGKIVNGSSVGDLDDYQSSKKYKKNGTINEPNALLQKNGLTASTSVWDVSNYIELPFNVGDKFYVQSTIQAYGAICFFDEDFNVVYSFNGNEAESRGYTQSINPVEREFTMGATWKYVRFCVYRYNSHTMSDCYVSSYSCGWVNLGNRIIDSVMALEEKTKFVKTLFDKKVLIVGDSISTYNYKNYKKWNDILKDKSFFGADYVNSSQHATGFVANTTGNSTCTARLKAVSNPSSFDFVIIFCGVNDFIQSIPWGETGGDASTEFIPAVDDFFDYLVKNFINARIVILSPLRTYNRYPNQVGKYLDDYAEAIRNKAKYYSLPVLNLTEESGFCPYVTEFKDAWTLVPSGYEVHDGVHPSLEYGRDFLAPMIAKFLQKFV